MSRPLTVLDLFAGAGGLTEGFRRAGRFRTVGAVEQDPTTAETYKANHPGVLVYADDIALWLAGSPVPADVVVGGPPCQGFSLLGKRVARDPRNALWRRYVDALWSVRPMYFIMENVADFLSSGQFGDLKAETYRNGRLKDYRIQHCVLNAAEFGAPQIRRRAVVIGSLRALPPVGIPRGALAGEPKSWVTVRSAIGDLDIEPLGSDLPLTRTETEHGVLRGPFKTVELHLGRQPRPTSLERYRAIPAGGNRRDLPEHLLAPCWRDHNGGSGDVMGRLHWDKPSVTIRTEFWKPEKGRYLHPTAHRSITHHEAARIQGFPDDYLWYGSKTQIGRQIGNAVPVPLAEGIARHLATLLANE
jgi:DNA (cytosine-5)-methyltransferase 1